LKGGDGWLTGRRRGRERTEIHAPAAVGRGDGGFFLAGKLPRDRGADDLGEAGEDEGENHEEVVEKAAAHRGLSG